MEQSGIKVSVIIPVYNTDAYIRRCLESVLAQTLEEIEVICVDDGSTDSSFEILQQYQRSDKRMFVLRQENHFAGVARNCGMKIAKGEYLYFLDSDDYIERSCLEEMYLAGKKNHSDVVICNSFCADMFLGRTDPRIVWEEEVSFPKQRSRFSRADVAGSLFQMTNGWAWDKLFYRNFIKKRRLQFASSRIANDGYFVYMALCLAERITKLDRRLVTHRMGVGSSLSNTRERSWHCGFQMFYDIEKKLKDAGVYDSLEQSFLNRAMAYMIWAMEDMSIQSVRKEIFQVLTGEAERRWRLLERGEDYFYDRAMYRKYNYMLSHSFEEYEDAYVVRFPFEKIPEGSKVVLYGAGRNGKRYYRQLRETGYAKTVFWIDQKFALKNSVEMVSDITVEMSSGGEVSKDILGWLDGLKGVDYDFIIITLDDERIVREIRKTLLNDGIPDEKIR